MDLKHILRQIQTDNANLFHGRLLQKVINVSILAHRCRRGASTPSQPATQVEEGGDPSGSLRAEARAYFDLATELLKERPPRLIAIGGLSGSGKTTIAEALAAHVGAAPGARIVESDRIRKTLHGVSPETRLPDKAYRPEVSERVYREMAWRANLVLAEGGSVV